MRNYLHICTIAVFALLITGCKHNVYHVDKNIHCPVSHTFRATYEKTWNAAIEAVMMQSTIDTMDKKSGYISTDIATVDGKEMNFMDHAFFGQTYKFTYDIRMRPQGKNATRVSTNVKLFVEQFMGISRRESDWDQIENYLREKLYKEICRKLYPNNAGHCLRGISNSASMVTNQNQEHNASPVHHKKVDKKVQKAQKALKNSGYKPGPADGIMGRKTFKAIKAFQSDNGLAATGKLDQATYELLTEYKIQKPSATTPQPAVYASPVPGSSTSKPIVSTRKDTQKETVVHSSSSITTVPDKPAGHYVTTDTTDLLQEQDLFGSEIIGSIPAGTTLHVLVKNGEYYKVRYKGKEGYVYGEFVEEN